MIAMVEHLEDTIDTTLLDGALQLRQLRTGHRSGTDALLLAACVGRIMQKEAAVLLDMGAGAGAAGLAVAVKNPRCQVILLEREAELAALAGENIRLNGLDSRARAACCDGLIARQRLEADLGDDCADILITNPPFHDARSTRVSPDVLKARAHTFDDETDGLESWLRACAAMLKPGGQLALIHRADALPALFKACSGRFGAMQVLPVHSKSGRPANRVVIKAIAGSRGPMKILQGLVLHNDSGTFTRRGTAIHNGVAPIDLFSAVRE